MKGQVTATAVAAVALKALHKTLLVWNSSSSSEAAGAGAFGIGSWDATKTTASKRDDSQLRTELLCLSTASLHTRSLGR